MAGGKLSKSDTNPPDDRGGRWPVWARRVVSVVLAVHLVALLTAALAAAPSSPLERALAEVFSGYHQAIDQGYAYRYYAPEPGPTPVVTARLRYGDGRPEETVRLPERGVWPRLRYQRQLALANHLVADFEEARRAGAGEGRSVWARSYARHLARARRGCATVTLYAQAHLIPDPARVREALEARSSGVDIDAEEFYTAPERIGEFPCDGF
jgi:hypothetical protein